LFSGKGRLPSKEDFWLWGVTLPSKQVFPARIPETVLYSGIGFAGNIYEFGFGLVFVRSATFSFVTQLSNGKRPCFAGAPPLKRFNDREKEK
jgi:hypothetical protein